MIPLLFMAASALLRNLLWAGFLQFATKRAAGTTLKLSLAYPLAISSLLLFVPVIWASLFDTLFSLRLFKDYGTVFIPLGCIIFLLLAAFYGQLIRTPNHLAIGMQKGFIIMLILTPFAVFMAMLVIVLMVMIAGV
jgi:hypothetical protein